MNRDVWAEISHGSILHNLSLIDRLSCHKGVIGVVKSDAYGHGAVEISRLLLDSGVKRLAVSGIDEGIRLRDAGIASPVLIMEYLRSGDLKEAFQHQLTPTANSLEMLNAVDELGKRLGRTLGVELRVDVDTSSMGFHYGQAGMLCEELAMLKHVNVGGIYAHIIAAYSGDREETENQLQSVRSFFEVINKAVKGQMDMHLFSSPGLLMNRRKISEAVRIGTMLYGIQSLQSQDISEIKPAMTIKSRIVAVNNYKHYNCCGYGFSGFSGEDAVIAVVGAGYRDLPVLSRIAEGSVLICGKRFKISGETFMNHFLVDITHSSGIGIGTEVVILGPDGDDNISAYEMAGKFGLGVERSEFPCLSGSFIKRVYTD